MKIQQLLERAQQSRPKLFNTEKSKRQTRQVRAIFAALIAELEHAPEGRINVEGLGSFNIKSVEREQNGQKKSVRRMIFRHAKTGKSHPQKTPADIPVIDK